MLANKAVQRLVAIAKGEAAEAAAIEDELREIEEPGESPE
jgi:hypothetical protein